MGRQAEEQDVKEPFRSLVRKYARKQGAKGKEQRLEKERNAKGEQERGGHGGAFGALVPPRAVGGDGARERRGQPARREHQKHGKDGERHLIAPQPLRAERARKQNAVQKAEAVLCGGKGGHKGGCAEKVHVPYCILPAPPVMKKPRLLWENLSARAEKKDAFAKGRHLSRPFGIRWRMGYELSLSRPRFLRVRRGHDARNDRTRLLLPPRVLAAFNGLKQEPERGGGAFASRGREFIRSARRGDKALLSGSEQTFEEKKLHKAAVSHAESTALRARDRAKNMQDTGAFPQKCALFCRRAGGKKFFWAIYTLSRTIFVTIAYCKIGHFRVKYPQNMIWRKLCPVFYSKASTRSIPAATGSVQLLPRHQG